MIYASLLFKKSMNSSKKQFNKWMIKMHNLTDPTLLNKSDTAIL